VNLSFLGIFTFTAPYLPWVLLAFSGAPAWAVGAVVSGSAGVLCSALAGFTSAAPSRAWVHGVCSRGW
jgi:hypothetical protein